jgi:hypothetical protein
MALFDKLFPKKNAPAVSPDITFKTHSWTIRVFEASFTGCVYHQDSTDRVYTDFEAKLTFFGETLTDALHAELFEHNGASGTLLIPCTLHILSSQTTPHKNQMGSVKEFNLTYHTIGGEPCETNDPHFPPQIVRFGYDEMDKKWILMLPDSRRTFKQTRNVEWRVQHNHQQTQNAIQRYLPRIRPWEKDNHVAEEFMLTVTYAVQTGTISPTEPPREQTLAG